MGGGSKFPQSFKTVVVLGAAYGGPRAAQILAAGMPEGWRVLLVDRNSHANHVYVMPRYAVLPGHEYKAFIRYSNVFRVEGPIPHLVLQAYVTSIHPNHITLSKAFPEYGIPTNVVPFDYAIYALGSHLPSPLNLWGTSPSKSDTVSKPVEVDATTSSYGGTKLEAIDWLKRKQKLIEQSETLLVVGGGALGIQFSTDIKAVYPSKKVTLLHSRDQLLPRFDKEMHNEILKTMDDVGIEVILGERLDLSTLEGGQAKVNAVGQKVVRTVKGREIAADLLMLCTGQTPNTQLLKTMDPATVNPENGLARVLQTLQLSTVPRSDEKGLHESLDKLRLSDAYAPEKEGQKTSPYPHIFAIGDAADAFGAIAAGHTAYSQGEVAARNVLRLIKRQEKAKDSISSGSESEELEKYAPSTDRIKVSLGMTKYVCEVDHKVITKNDGVPDLYAASMWPLYGIKVEKEEDMLE